MIGKLLGIRLRSFVSSLGGRSKRGEYKPPSVGRIVVLSLLLLYLVGTFAMLATTVAIALLSVSDLLGAPWLFFAMYAALPFAVIFMFSVFETKAELFECRDTELLLSLPLRSRDVVISRLLSVVLLNYAEAAVLMWPFLFVYAIAGGAPLAILGGILAYLLVPLLSTALSTGVGYLVARISAAVKRKTLVTMVLYLAFFVAYFWLYQSLFAMGDGSAEDLAASLSPLASVGALRFVGEAVMLTPLPTLSLVLVTVGAALLVFFVVERTFLRVAIPRHGARRRAYTGGRATRRSAFASLARKEISRFFSNATYMINSAMGVTLTLLLTGAVLFSGAELQSALLSELGMTVRELTPIIILALVAVTMMNYPSACALSLEGKSLWLLRSLPVREDTVLLAKCVPHVLVCTVPSSISAIVLSVALRASFGQVVAFLLLPPLAGVACALFGILLNVAFPKLDYTSEAQPVKNSMAAMLSMFLQMIVGILMLFAGSALVFIGIGWVALVITALLLLFLCALLYVLVTRVSARKLTAL